MSQVPYAAYCPTCDAGRTFNLCDAPPSLPRPVGRSSYVVACVVCGTTERDAFQSVAAELVPLRRHRDDDRDTIGEIAERIEEVDAVCAGLVGKVERLGRALGELRDDFTDHATARVG